MIDASGCGGIEPPFSRNASERVNAPVGEDDPRSDHDVLHGTGYQRLARACRGCDAGADVYGDAADVAVGLLDLAGVQARAHVEPERSRAVADRERAADRARRAVEGREEPVAGR